MIQRRVCSVGDPEYSEVEACFEPRRPPFPQKVTENMWAEVNRLRQELSPLQPPPQYDFLT